MSLEIKIPIICGPTGSGKTKLAFELSKKIPLEIISADSRQMIRHLDIGTAKPDRSEQSQVRFHLIDIIDPGERYTAFKFIGDADSTITESFSRNRLPLVVGGTGLYLRALTDGIFDMDSDDTSVRTHLEKEMEELGPELLYKKLQEVDPDEAATIHPNNKVRLIRALEVFRLTGKPKSELMKSAHYRKSKYHYSYYCLLPDRGELYRAIDKRVDSMMASGFLDEVIGLADNNYRAAVQRMNVIGYSELLDHLNGNLSLDEAVSLIKQNSRRYAKRQSTWFRNQLKGEFFGEGTGLKSRVLKDYERFEKKDVKKLDTD